MVATGSSAMHVACAVFLDPASSAKTIRGADIAKLASVCGQARWFTAEQLRWRPPSTQTAARTPASTPAYRYPWVLCVNHRQ